MIVYDRLYIGGRWTEPTDPQLLDIRSPHDRSLIGRAAQATNADIDKAVAAAREAFDHGPWGRTTPEQRQDFIVRLNKLRAARADEIAGRISAEVGAARWFTDWGQPALDKQADAYLRAGWAPRGAWCAGRRSASWPRSSRGTRPIPRRW